MTQSFDKLIGVVTEVGQLYDDLVYIGGIAVYLHSINHESTRQYAESTTDADLYISLSNLSDLRSIEELTQNPRLGKQEFQKDGFSFDVYAERQCNLPVPYAFVAAHAVIYDRVKVASIEDLLVLKLEAAAARHASEHGRKDAKDIIRLLLLASEGPFDIERSTAFMQDKHFKRLEAIVQGAEFMSLAAGNSKTAKALRGKAESVFALIDDEYNSEQDDTHGSKPGAERSV